MKKERDPTAEEFEKLLAWLDSDRDAAGRKYETIRHRLIRIFISRGCIDATVLTDEVMNRVAVRIDTVVKTYWGDPAKCFQGFADNVYREDLRGQQQRSDVDPSLQHPSLNEREHEEHDEEQREQEDECLTRCMEELTTPEGELFGRYFREEKRAKIDGRKKMAIEMGITANALRIKAHRIRRWLRRCMEACLQETETIRN